MSEHSLARLNIVVLPLPGVKCLVLQRAPIWRYSMRRSRNPSRPSVTVSPGAPASGFAPVSTLISTVTPGRCAAGKECWSERRARTRSSPLVKAGKQRVCQALHDAPIRAQGDGFAGECTGRRLRRPAGATSDFRTLGRRATEIRTGRLIGVETGHWHIRLGPRGGAEAAASSRLGAPFSPGSWLALARGGCWHAACSPQS
jgi:hypothetical protein